MQKEKPIFNKRIFWDVDFEKLDYDKSYRFVIERVFERGDVPDIRACRRYYEEEVIRDVILNCKFLPERSMHLAACVIEREVNELRCYKLRQLNQAHLPY